MLVAAKTDEKWHTELPFIIIIIFNYYYYACGAFKMPTLTRQRLAAVATYSAPNTAQRRNQVKGDSAIWLTL